MRRRDFYHETWEDTGTIEAKYTELGTVAETMICEMNTPDVSGPLVSQLVAPLTLELGSAP